MSVYCTEFIFQYLLENRGDAASHLANSKQRDGQRTIATETPAGEISSSSASAAAQETNVSREDDKKNETIATAMSLLLAARERVLTLSEQRVSDCCCFSLYSIVLT